MKKIAYAFTALVFMLCACHKEQNMEIDNDIIIFTQQGCPHCEKAVDFINNSLLQKNPSLRIKQIDVSHNDQNFEILQSYLKKYNFHETRIGTPVIIFNNQLVMGWDLTNKFKLKKAFDL
jgi:glutaredoxin